VATMLAQLPTVLGTETNAAVPLLCEKLQSDGTRYVAVAACGTVAGTTPPLPLAQYVPQLITTMTPFLRKAHRGLRCAALAALAHVLAVHSAGAGVQADLLEPLLQEAAELITDGDLLLAAAALRMCEASLQVWPLANLLPRARLLVHISSSLPVCVTCDPDCGLAPATATCLHMTAIARDTW